MKWLLEKFATLWHTINQLVGNETEPWMPDVLVNGEAWPRQWNPNISRWVANIPLQQNQIVYQTESELQVNPDLCLWWFFDSRVVLPSNKTHIRLYVDKLVSYHIRGEKLKHTTRKLHEEDCSPIIYDEIRSIFEQCHSYEWYGEYEVEFAVEDQQTGFEVAFVITVPVFQDSIML